MQDMNTRTNQNKIVSVMRSSRGRFFGLTTTQGNQVNARFVNETPRYVRVYDRNSDRNLTIAKASLAGIRYGKTVIA
jgi:hypothetical protein